MERIVIKVRTNLYGPKRKRDRERKEKKIKKKKDHQNKSSNTGKKEANIVLHCVLELFLTL